jgi:hypothetical protein
MTKPTLGNRGPAFKAKMELAGDRFHGRSVARLSYEEDLAMTTHIRRLRRFHRLILTTRGSVASSCLDEPADQGFSRGVALLVDAIMSAAC